MEKAIISCGQYQICQQYCSLCCSEDTWFRMTSNQWLKHIKKFNSCSVCGQDVSNSSELTQSSCSSTAAATVEDSEIQQNDITIGKFHVSQSQNVISLSHKEALMDTRVPEETAEGIWRKAKMLITEPNAVVVATGCGPKDKSKSGSTPHLVKTSGNCDYECDSNCMQ